MKILALVTEAYGGAGGIARFNRDLLKALSQIEPQPEIVILPRVRPYGARNDGLVGKLGYATAALKTFWQQGPFDLIFCGHLHLAPLAALLSRMKKTPVWLQIHGIEAWQRPSDLLARAAESSDLVTAVSRHTRREFLEWASIDPGKVRVLPNTVDENFTPGPKPDYLLKRYGLENKKILFTLSRLSSQEKYKGHDRVIRVLPRLLEKFPSLVYTIGGSGDDQARLQALAGEYRLKDAVMFLGEIKETELADHYRMADLFVMPSTGEGFGIVFLEAARSGIPVVAAGAGGAFDALLEGKIGRLVNPDDADALAQAIEETLASRTHSPKLVQRFSSANFHQLVETLMNDRLVLTGVENG